MRFRSVVARVSCCFSDETADLLRQSLEPRSARLPRLRPRRLGRTLAGVLNRWQEDFPTLSDAEVDPLLERPTTSWSSI
jgi:hypothetical protein